MDPLDRLFHRLRQALVNRGADMRAPFTVAELYQQLVPYRAVRAELGLLELAPYEHALLRLLAGERGYLEVARAGVVDELRRELAEPNPILGVYRDYADVEVFLTEAPEHSAQDSPVETFVAPPLAPASPALRRGGDAPLRPSSPAGEPAVHSSEAADPRPTDAVRRGDGEPELTSEVGCTRCGERLPDVEGLRFCHACGADQAQPSCARCRAEVQAGWRFCVRCGHDQGQSSV